MGGSNWVYYRRNAARGALRAPAPQRARKGERRRLGGPTRGGWPPSLGRTASPLSPRSAPYFGPDLSESLGMCGGQSARVPPWGRKMLTRQSSRTARRYNRRRLARDRRVRTRSRVKKRRRNPRGLKSDAATAAVLALVVAAWKAAPATAAYVLRHLADAFEMRASQRDAARTDERRAKE